MGTPSLSNQCPFEADTARLVRGHDLTDSEVSPNLRNVSPRRERQKRERERAQIYDKQVSTLILDEYVHTQHFKAVNHTQTQSYHKFLVIML